jgi:O-acetylhomoserine/O-acetylserine sulfhydrylase-like pyridoxal-dependent enzyme
MSITSSKTATTQAPLEGVSSIATHTHKTLLHSHVPPIFQTSTFSFEDVASAASAFSGEDAKRFVYSRGRNPDYQQTLVP